MLERNTGVAYYSKSATRRILRKQWLIWSSWVRLGKRASTKTSLRPVQSRDFCEARIVRPIKMVQDPIDDIFAKAISTLATFSYSKSLAAQNADVACIDAAPPIEKNRPLKKV